MTSHGAQAAGRKPIINLRQTGLRMRLTDFISPEAVIANVKATTKKQLLMELSERAAQLSDVPAREIFDALLHRERLGSTGIGEGVAIPHGKLAKVKSIFGIFARLERPIDFDSLDGAPVDCARSIWGGSFESSGLCCARLAGRAFGFSGARDAR